jgi:hypothetical protein
MNITCPKCRYRHPANKTCFQAKVEADEARGLREEEYEDRKKNRVGNAIKEAAFESDKELSETDENFLVMLLQNLILDDSK